MRTINDIGAYWRKDARQFCCWGCGGSVDGSIGEKTIEVVVMGKEVWVSCLILPRLVNGFEIIIGMDVISRLSGICIQGSKVTSMHGTVAAAVAKKSSDGHLRSAIKTLPARFDGNRWEVEWRWERRTTKVKQQNGLL